MVIDAKPIVYSLVQLKDEDWKRVRRVISPVFSQHKVMSSSIREEIDSCVDRTIAALKSRALNVFVNGSFESEVYPVMQATTLDVILRTACNMKNHDVYDEKDPILHAVRQFFSEAQNNAVWLAMYVPFLRPLMTFVNNYLTAGKMTDMVLQHLKKEISESTVKKDSTTFLHSLIKKFERKEISENEVIGNAHIVLLAGYETTANAVTFGMIHFILN